MGDAAAAIAKKTGETLVLTHVCGVSFAGGGAVPESLRMAAGSRLREEAERLRQTGVTVEEQLLEGSAEEAILALCDRLPVRLIVVASQRKREVPARWFFGGLIEQLTGSAQVPTLVVRDAGMIENWLSGKEPLRIFVAISLGSLTEIPLFWVKGLAEIAPCEITVGYLHWISDEVLRLGLSEAPLFEESPQLGVMLEHELRERAAGILGDLPLKILVRSRWGRAGLPLIDMAEMAEADLFVVGTRLRSGFSRIFGESVSTEILRHAPMGVAVIPLLSTVVDVPLPVPHRILVPTDFSGAANVAIRYACAISPEGGTVHLVHVLHRFGGPAEEFLERLVSLIPPESAGRGVHFETVVWRDDLPAQGILTLAARFRSDVICIGTHGSSGLVAKLLGSTAQEVLANSTIPVFLTRQPC